MIKKEKLIEIINSCCTVDQLYALNKSKAEYCVMEIADALIKAGVILPKYKIGQEVWCIVSSYFRPKIIDKGKICAIKYFENDIGEKWFEYMISRNKDDCDPHEVQEKYVFLSEAETKEALRGK